METVLLTAIISAGTSIATVLVIKPFVDGRLHKFQLKHNYRAEQSKKIKDLLGIYKGGLLKSGEMLNNRLKNYNADWLNKKGDHRNNHHYLDTTVYRFLAFFGYIKLIEQKIIFLDTTISQNNDLRLIKYFRLFNDIMCDVDLFEGFQYDNNFATDHFFTSPFENMSNCVLRDGNVINLELFLEDKLTFLDKIEPIYKFFDGITPNESRLRLERLKTFHIVLIAFLNEFGYDYQKTPLKKFDYLKAQLGSYKLLDNFAKMVKRYKLNKFRGEVEKIASRIK